MWLGPAPWAPYHEYRVSGSYNINGTSWRSWSDYSGGGMTDWVRHKFGGAMFAADVRDQGPVEIIPPDGKDHKWLTYVFANGAEDLSHAGQARSQRRTWSARRARSCRRSRSRHTREPAASTATSFIACKTREKPFRDIELAHRTATVCHLGNIAYELKRPLKWDAVKEEFPGDEEANRFLDRAKREPWQLS